ncbi:MAG TPA: tetratricopeptide repeat protein [Chloroflexota bacterium]|nr:tetratricopeptide repeat protein [Chloroflexota bacterium]
MDSLEQPTLSATKTNRRPLLIGCGLIMACIVVSCGVFTVMVSRANSQYDKAVAALAAGDCVTAVPALQALADNPFATEDDIKKPALIHIATCTRFEQLVASQNGGDAAGALVGYEDLMTEHKDSPLFSTIENQAKTVFTAAPTQVANLTTCNRLDSYLKRSWIPDQDTNLPLYYQACGQAYTAAGEYTSAVKVYQRFVTAYPNHPDYTIVEAQMAKAAVAEARAAGAGEIAPPTAIGDGDGSGPAVVVIQNDSREELSLVFSGPEARFETLEPCAECQDYFGSGPEFCPELGHIGTYEVPPGTYDAVVKSISDEGVTPFTGTWELTAGEEYYSCFFLITE